MGNDMEYTEAVSNLATGKYLAISRREWNNRGIFIFLIQENHWDFTSDVSGLDELDTLMFFCLKTSDNKLIPWIGSQLDILADDWIAVQ